MAVRPSPQVLFSVKSPMQSRNLFRNNKELFHFFLPTFPFQQLKPTIGFQSLQRRGLTERDRVVARRIPVHMPATYIFLTGVHRMLAATEAAEKPGEIEMIIMRCVYLFVVGI